jgi:predicted small secreted protein
MTRTLTIILIITLAAASIGLFLASCATYQPMGEDIWRVL